MPVTPIPRILTPKSAAIHHHLVPLALLIDLPSSKTEPSAHCNDRSVEMSGGLPVFVLESPGLYHNSHARETRGWN